METGSPLPRTAFDNALASVLMPPATPVDLQARVTAAIARDCARRIEQSRLQMQEDHAGSIDRLRRRLVWQCIEAVAFASCMFLPTRSIMHALSFWPGSRILDPSTIVAALLSPTIAVLGLVSMSTVLSGSLRSR